MARAVNRLTARSVQTITRPGRHADGDGLYLVVDDGGAKRWSLLIAVHGRRREFGLGNVRDVSLADARQKAQDARQAIRRGDDPKAPRGPSPTFSEAATVMIAEMASGWSGNTESLWTRSLLVHAGSLEKKPVDVIDTDDVVKAVRPYWKSGETGRKLRQRIESLLDFAAVKGWRDGEIRNPARLKGHLDRLLPKQTRKVKHHPALPYQEMPAFMLELATKTESSARALEWTIYTVAREGMTLLARHAEVDGDVWTVPADHMKGQNPREFRIPLTPQALASRQAVIIMEADPAALIFPGQTRGRSMSARTMDALVARIVGGRAVPHGFRSTFRDWAYEETDHPREIVEAALAHLFGDATERAYRRGEALRKRRLLLTDWADFIRPPLAPATEAVPSAQSPSAPPA